MVAFIRDELGLSLHRSSPIEGYRRRADTLFAARFYDQQLGRWQTQDPASQFANPYLAMANSWPNGIDPTGTSWFTNWMKNLLLRPITELEIIAGLFAYNNHQTVGGNVIDFFSRLTWQAPQEAMGLLAATGEDMAGLVNKVSYFDGATVLNTNYLVNDDWPVHSASAFTLGSYINGPSAMQANPSDPTFQHEYGRYLQSQADGPTYLTFTAIPDLHSPGNFGPTAMDGNARALIYFDRYYGGVGTNSNPGPVIWYFDQNPVAPIGVYNQNDAITSSANQAALRGSMRTPGILNFMESTAAAYGLLSIDWLIFR